MRSDQVQSTVLTSTDEEELRAAGNRMFSPHRLRLGQGRARLGAIELGGLIIGRLCYGAEAVVVADPIDYFSVQLPTIGSGTVRFDGETVAMRRGRGVVFNPGDGAAFELQQDLDRIALKLPPAVMIRHLSSLLGQSVDRPLRFQRFASAGSVPWMSALYLLAREVDPFGAATARESLAVRATDAFLTSLLLAQPHSWSVRLHEAPPSDRGAVSRAVDLIEAEPQTHWTLTGLAETAGVGGRSLQVAFQRELGVSPTRFVREVRLRRCYELLRDSASDGIPISDIAAANGFSHFGRFARAFRERYGILPSEVRRSRS